ARQIAGSGNLQLDHFCTQQAKLISTEGSCQDIGQVEHPNALERGSRASAKRGSRAGRIVVQYMRHRRSRRRVLRSTSRGTHGSPLCMGLVILAPDKWIGNVEIAGDPHAFRLQIFLDRFSTGLAPDAGMLEAAKRGREARRAVVVDPDRSGLELVG